MCTDKKQLEKDGKGKIVKTTRVDGIKYISIPNLISALELDKERMSGKPGAPGYIISLIKRLTEMNDI